MKKNMKIKEIDAPGDEPKTWWFGDQGLNHSTKFN